MLSLAVRSREGASCASSDVDIDYLLVEAEAAGCGA